MVRRLSSYEHLVPLLLRFGVGLIFLFAGWSKVSGGVDKVAGYFGSLGIPLAGLMAPFIAYLELFGGLALILGVLTRLFSLLFIGDMAVAILLAQLPKAMEAGNAAAAFGTFRLEFLLLLASASLVLLGAGALSVDAALLGDRPRALRAEEVPA